MSNLIFEGTKKFWVFIMGVTLTLVANIKIKKNTKMSEKAWTRVRLGPRGGGTLTFAYYRGTDNFFGFKILSFTIFLGVEVSSTIFMGMPI